MIRYQRGAGPPGESDAPFFLPEGERVADAWGEDKR
jgi:hypothetical protein